MSDPFSNDEAAMIGAAVLDSIHEFLGRFVAYPSAHARNAHTLRSRYCCSDGGGFDVIRPKALRQSARI